MIKMTIPKNISTVEVYYDGQCGMCCTFHEWINEQQRAYEVKFIPYQSERAELLFPGVMALDPASEMIVRTNDGELFRGAQAWVLCLYSCSSYQKVAVKLGGPLLLPVAIKACNVLAANRHKLSKVFFGKKDKIVAKELHKMPTPKCERGACGYDA